MIDASRLQPATYSRRSRNIGCAQCTSSMQTTSGRSRASVSQKPADGPERFLARAGQRARSERAGDPLDDQRSVGLGFDEADHRALTADRAHELRERQERDAVAVRKAAGGQHGCTTALFGDELPGEPGFPDSSGAVDGDETARPRLAPRPSSSSRRKASSRVRPTSGGIEPPRKRRRAGNRAEHAPRFDRRLLALRLNLAGRLELGRVLDEPTRRGADQDLVQTQLPARAAWRCSQRRRSRASCCLRRRRPRRCSRRSGSAACQPISAFSAVSARRISERRERHAARRPRAPAARRRPPSRRPR